MVPCLEGLLNTAPSAKAPREGEWRRNQWLSSSRPAAQILKLTLTCPWRSFYVRVCVCVCTSLLCMKGRGACVCSWCACMRLSPCQKHSCLHSDVWFHSIWSIYPENERSTFSFLFSPRGLFLWRHPSFTFLSLFQFSLSHNFFQSRCLTLPSSLKLCWGHNLELQPSSRNTINPDIPISV